MDREVSHAFESAYTASQLIEELQLVDPDARVFFTCCYGDHGRTMQALPVAETKEAETKHLATTGYSDSGVELLEDRRPEPDEDSEEPDEVFPIVILQS